MSTDAKTVEQPGAQEEYLSLCPLELRAATDLNLVVNQRQFCVHSFLVISQSVVLREAILGCSFGNSGRSDSPVPLLGDDPDMVKDALKYLYRRTFAPQPAQLASRLEAVNVATFAHKYSCANLTLEADAFLAAEAAGPSALTLLATPDPKRVGQTGDVQHGAWDVLDYTAHAQDTGLTRLLCHCIHWLASQRQVIRDTRERLAILTPPTLTTLTMALATDTPPNSTGPWCGGCGRTFYSGAQPAADGVTPLATILSWHGLT